ncbi:MAG: hydrogenase nickel incorporation protein HypB [Alphaproteobacteria bacterium]|nr:hydrogenase nickel incorporation protein HypB [Alphaproteobacteria bacterium]
MCDTCGCAAETHAHHHHKDHDAEKHLVKVEEDILSENNAFAEANRRLLEQHKILALNLVSSPGSGKTTLLARTLSSKRFLSAVIEGDQSTDIDAERLRATGAPAVQINTGRGCHLDAHMVGHAMSDLGIGKGALDGGVLFIENVGNLVCPAAFDLGEAAKVVLLSVTEGEDKPLKYPDMFRAAKLMIVTKSDLLPYVQFDMDRCLGYAKKINPDIEHFVVSSTSGEGEDAWMDWLDRARCMPRNKGFAA